jgi:hypothetical protein
MIKSEQLRRRLPVFPAGAVVDAVAPRHEPATPRPLPDHDRAYEDAVSEGWPDRSGRHAP